MRSIIVGTDFSRGSEIALGFATDIAQQMKCDILLVWVKKPKKLLSNELLDMTTRLAEDKLKQYCETWSDNFDGDINYKILEGKVASAIGEEAKKLDAPMIVIGTNGASGFEQYIMGSTAVRIVSESPCPVLTIREGFTFNRTFNRIVLPIRVNANSRQKVGPAAMMAKIFNAQVDILGLLDMEEDTSTLRTYIRQVEDKLFNEGVSYRTVFRKYSNYSDTVLNFANEVKGDLVIINTEQDKILARLFLGTNAQQIVHRSQIPVLCIHPEDINWLAK